MRFTDQLHRPVELAAWPPRRIVSLVPSQTELLHTLGLEQEVLGITKFCVHPPEWLRGKTRVGGTKTLNMKQIEALRPDLIIGNREENDRAQIEALATRWPVWMSDILTLDDATDMILRVGQLSDRAEPAAALVAEIRRRFEGLAAASLAHRPPLRAAYFIWRKPYMVAASGTFIHDMLGRAGFQNAFAHLTRYPEVSPEELAAARPDVLLLSSEPYPFSEKHFGAFREICPAAQIEVADGEMFSWYGSRMLLAAGYFERLRPRLKC
jgi:ABC-type Fe3+-hydroxamate transport system substrate-binding protein